MAYELEQHEGFIEAHLSGETSKYEILQTVGEIARMDPRKDLADLWCFEGDGQIPFQDFFEIAEAIRKKMPEHTLGVKTALVVADAFHQAQLEFFVAEASILNLDMQIFQSRDEAVSWIMGP